MKRVTAKWIDGEPLWRKNVYELMVIGGFAKSRLKYPGEYTMAQRWLGLVERELQRRHMLGLHNPDPDDFEWPCI